MDRRSFSNSGGLYLLQRRRDTGQPGGDGLLFLLARSLISIHTTARRKRGQQGITRTTTKMITRILGALFLFGFGGIGT